MRLAAERDYGIGSLVNRGEPSLALSFLPFPTHLHVYSSPSKLTAHLDEFQGHDSQKKEPKNEII